MVKNSEYEKCPRINFYLEVSKLKQKLTLRYILAAALIPALVALSGCSAQTKSEDTTAKATIAKSTVASSMRPEIVTSGAQAKQLLVEGNSRFISGTLAYKDLGGSRRDELVKNGQHPFAVIVSCSDSRVPPEEIFDQALGDLFVVRVAGNVIGPIETGSVEYAVEHLQAPLVVVLGHEKCGAVTAAVKGGEAPGSIGSIVEKIKPSVEKAQAAGTSAEELVEKTAELNVEASIEELEKSPIIEHLVKSGKLSIVGAKYHLGSGTAEWLEEEKK